jgi:hypothetical protein
MIGHAAAAARDAFFSPGFRRFGPSFARDYLRFAWGVARRRGDRGPAGGPDPLVQVLREGGFDDVTVSPGVSGADGIIRARRTRSAAGEGDG